MNECEKKEIIKAFAYGITAEQVSMECDISVDEAEQFRYEHADEIAKKAGEIHE